MSFDEVIGPLLPIEGVYSNTPGDSGGEAVFGIDMTSNPGSPVWPEVRRLQNSATPQSIWKQDVALMAAVYSTYKSKYWDPAQLDYFPSTIQEAAFGCAVNEGIGGMARLIQRAAARTGQQVVEDGEIGPATLKAVNAAPIGWLEDAFWRLRAEAYLGIANAHPITQAQFLRGWLNRIEQGL